MMPKTIQLDKLVNVSVDLHRNTNGDWQGIIEADTYSEDEGRIVTHLSYDLDDLNPGRKQSMFAFLDAVVAHLGEQSELPVGQNGG